MSLVQWKQGIDMRPAEALPGVQLQADWQRTPVSECSCSRLDGTMRT